MKYPNILFCGRAGSGKNFLANEIIKKYGYKEISFAKPLKIIAEREFGYEGKKDRYILQRLGTLGRMIYPELWCQMAYTTLEYISRYEKLKPRGFIITDCRYLNEVDFFKAKGNWIVIKLNCARKIRFKRLYERDGYIPSQKELQHSSETELDKIIPDYSIDTGGTKEKIWKEMDKIIRR